VTVAPDDAAPNDVAPSQAIARYLRQCQELGLVSLTFDGLSRSEVLASAERTLGQGRGSRETPIPPRTPRPSAVAEKSFLGQRPARGTDVDSVAHASLQPTLGPPAPTQRARSAMEVPAGRNDLPVLPDTLPAVASLCSGCTRCGLSETRTQTVFAAGVQEARLMVVGEAPGQEEDATGLPFVGRAGLLLDLLLQTIDHSRRDSVYICNVIKCRPPGNRNPTRDEIAACTPWLKQQIALVRPSVILAVGTFAGQFLSGKEETLGQLRKDVHAYEGVPVVVTYHPAALLRNRGWIWATWQDVQRVARMLKALPEVAP
jgi:uracil-DNA glycosylase